MRAIANHRPLSQILYCTLNTHNFRDVEAILGNYLSFGDLIVVHVCGQSKELHLVKTQEYLGLTITDNGLGRAFVKRVKSDQQIVEEQIRQGAHIAAINAEPTFGLRHYEVAKAIRDVPKGTNFTMLLIEPKYSPRYFNPEQEMLIVDTRQLDQTAKFPNRILSPMDRDFFTDSRTTSPAAGSDLFYDELIQSSLPIDRLLSKQTRAAADKQQQPQRLVGAEETSRLTQEIIPDDSYKLAIDKINAILDSFLGINDNLLAIQIYRLARENKDSYVSFLTAIQTSELSEFNFNDDTKKYLWNCATCQTIVQ